MAFWQILVRVIHLDSESFMDIVEVWVYLGCLPMLKYIGHCHCQAIKFEFFANHIDRGLRCNCSMCVRRGALMSDFTLAPDELMIQTKPELLGTYSFGPCVAKHHFCKVCGIYPFHQTMIKPGHYRVNLGCVDGINSLDLKFRTFNGLDV